MGKSNRYESEGPKRRNLIVRDMIVRGSPSHIQDRRMKRNNSRVELEREIEDSDLLERPEKF